MASKDSYPKGPAMNMIIPLAFIELDVREVLNGDQTLKNCQTWHISSQSNF